MAVVSHPVRVRSRTLVVHKGACVTYPEGVHIFPMTLLEHLKETGETVAQFAQRVGRHEGTIKKIAYGQRSASVELALEIERATGGSVNAVSLNQSVGIVRDVA